MLQNHNVCGIISKQLNYTLKFVLNYRVNFTELEH